LIVSSPGNRATNMAGMIAKYLAMSLAIENVLNAVIIVALIPLALRGVQYTPSSASKLLSRNLYIYGLGGIVAPFIGIKLIDLVVQFIPGMG
jgi:potassium-transporting ATPase ATP-binding subunit